ncbi:MAG: hypothetical protein WC408_03190 [Candidatus Micrarchaeia archaeon]|jgi:hypothetical protein
MAKKDEISMQTIGAYAFLFGVLLAIVAGFFGGFGIGPEVILLTLGVLGLLVGLLNITEKETVPFLVAAVAINVSLGSLSTVITNVLGIIPAFAGIAAGLVQSLGYLMVFVSPAAAVVAVLAIWNMAKDQ